MLGDGLDFVLVVGIETLEDGSEDAADHVDYLRRGGVVRKKTDMVTWTMMMRKIR